tara:strand:- start:133758 stop:134219 length:462 start_codon:yes stop_codon:yes gene_type:complete
MILPVSIVMFVKDIGPDGLSLWMQERIEEDKSSELHGMMEFPGGKIENGESSEEAARREVEEEVGITVKDYLPIFKRHSYTRKDKTILLHVHFSNVEDLPLDKGEWFSLKYETKSEHLKGKIPAVNHEFIDLFLGYIKKQREAEFLERLWQRS